MVVAFNEQVLYSRIDVGALRPGTVDPPREASGPNTTRTRRSARPIARRSRTSRRSGATSCSRSRWTRSAARSSAIPGAARTSGPSGYALRDLRPRPRRGGREIERQAWARRARRSSTQQAAAALRRVTTGLSRTSRSATACRSRRAAETDGGDERQPGRGPGRHGRGHRGLRDVPDHAGHLRLALPVQRANFHKVGGFVHQAEDEISAIGFALGASYAGKTAVTVTSGPGLALKTEFLGLAVMAELPLVIVVVQRGSPSTGLPTRVEQGDLLAAHPSASPATRRRSSSHRRPSRSASTSSSRRASWPRPSAGR